MSAPVLQLRVPGDTLTRLDSARGEETRSAWTLRLIERELASATREPGEPTAAFALPPGEPSPGAICMTPRCFQRDTSRYGSRKLPLCPACAAALQGERYHRALSPAQARALGRTPAA